MKKFYWDLEQGSWDYKHFVEIGVKLEAVGECYSKDSFKMILQTEILLTLRTWDAHQDSV